MKAREMGITVGALEAGPRDSIADVAGVRVGHATIDTELHKTGVTVILPCEDDPFLRKLTAASFVLNGFGKTQGLVQVDELGALETPIALTGTLNVGLVHDALVEHMLLRAEAGGYPLNSVNPVVCECNDGALNWSRERAVGRKEVFAAIESASADFAEGDVGCGKGLTCHGLKGGVGSASRVFGIGAEEFTVGALVQANHGRLGDLAIGGRAVGREIEARLREDEPDKGSCIVVFATDLPLTARQLRRVIKRAGVGLARLGSFWGHGSGDIFLGFTTANRQEPEAPFQSLRSLREDLLDLPFRAAAECAEEAVLNALLSAGSVTGWSGTTRRSLREFLE